jgi:hypothetical protein
MPRTDLFIKVEIEHEEGEPPERLAGEICRRILKVYGVRSAELSSAVPHAEE